MEIVKTLTNFYSKLSNYGKILVFVALLLVVVVFFRTLTSPNTESFNVDMVNQPFLFKEGTAVYDDFYADVYNYLVLNSVKNDYEVGTIIDNATPSQKSIIADIGSGNGHEVAKLSSLGLDIIGVDISPEMVQKAKKNYPVFADKFKLGNALDGNLFKNNSLTHILCLHFTIYYMENKMQFFHNCMKWLMPGGHLIIHLIDKYKVNPILPSENPLYAVSPAKSQGQIATKQLVLNDLMYNSNFKLHDEKINFNDGELRQQPRIYMEDLPSIVNIAQDIGFVLHAKFDMVKYGYEYQYLYVFVKPS
jgi:SAM-dependent methyltransferase